MGVGRLDASVHTGAPAFKHTGGAPFFEYLERHPDVAACFDRNMSGRHETRNATVVAAYDDFGVIATLVDIGGGEGALLRSILAVHPVILLMEPRIKALRFRCT